MLGISIKIESLKTPKLQPLIFDLTLTSYSMLLRRPQMCACVSLPLSSCRETNKNKTLHNTPTLKIMSSKRVLLWLQNPGHSLQHGESNVMTRECSQKSLLIKLRRNSSRQTLDFKSVSHQELIRNLVVLIAQRCVRLTEFH